MSIFCDSTQRGYLTSKLKCIVLLNDKNRNITARNIVVKKYNDSNLMDASLTLYKSTYECVVTFEINYFEIEKCTGPKDLKNCLLILRSRRFGFRYLAGKRFFGFRYPAGKRLFAFRYPAGKRYSGSCTWQGRDYSGSGTGQGKDCSSSGTGRGRDFSFL